MQISRRECGDHLKKRSVHFHIGTLPVSDAVLPKGQEGRKVNGQRLQVKIMIIKMPRATKAELILTILNQWDPAHKEGAAGFMYYNVEAEEIAQKVRKNSKLSTIENAIQESIGFKLELEHVEEPLDPDEVTQVAKAIQALVKNM